MFNTIQIIEANTRLTALDFSNTLFCGKDLFTELILGLNKHPSITSINFSHVLTQLGGFDDQKADLSYPMVEIFNKLRMPKLKDLNLQDNNANVDNANIVEFFEVNTGLRNLNLSSSCIAVEQLTVGLIKNKLEKLSLGSTKLNQAKIVDFIRSLHRNKYLLDLDLSNLYLDRNKADDITEYLRSNPPLRSIDLISNHFKGTEVDQILESLYQNTNLEQLYINSTDEAESIVQLQNLGPLLEKNNSLTHLDFSFSTLAIANLHQFVKSLSFNQGLIKLSLVNCDLTDLIIDAISSALTGNTRLKILDISANPDITFVGWNSLALMVQVNTTLEKLDFRACTIDTASQEIIIDGLIRNIGIRDLSLRCINSDSKEKLNMNKICDLVRLNKTLQYLDISMNKVGRNEMILLDQAVMNNTTLISINAFMSSTKFGIMSNGLTRLVKS